MTLVIKNILIEDKDPLITHDQYNICQSIYSYNINLIFL